MRKRTVLFTLGLVCWCLTDTSIAAPAPGNDYGKAESWLCRPGHNDACGVDLSTTVVAADGTLTREEFAAKQKPAIDCFYVYPTVSKDPTGNSDMNPGPEELRVILMQFARFSAQCRMYAPMYRQVTLTALRAVMAGKDVPIDRELAYNDVLDAWKHYLKYDNQGRGVVLIGHSQGSGVLLRLIRDEIDGKPIQSKLVSAMLMGWNVPVPKGKDAGGAFVHIPLCHSASQIHCLIAYSSFRSTSPPPAGTQFAHVPEPSMLAACTNPAALGGGSGQLHSYFAAAGVGNPAATAPFQWAAPMPKIETPFVSTPGLLSAQCVADEFGSYLQIVVNADPSDPRSDDIPGDVVILGQVQKQWGLHLIDVNLAEGNLIDIIGEQAKAYLAPKK